MKNTQAKTLTATALSAALIAVGAFIKIQMPFGLSMTMQVFFVILSAFLIGKHSAFAAFSYMSLGLIGLPIFSLGGGFNYILQPSFGYILAFIPSGYLMGKLTQSQNLSFFRYFMSALFGILLIYAIGILYFSLILKFYLQQAVTPRLIIYSLFLSLIWKDILSAVLAAVIAVRIRRLIRS